MESIRVAAVELIRCACNTQSTRKWSLVVGYFGLQRIFDRFFDFSIIKEKKQRKISNFRLLIRRVLLSSPTRGLLLCLADGGICVLCVCLCVENLVHSSRILPTPTTPKQNRILCFVFLLLYGAVRWWPMAEFEQNACDAFLSFSLFLYSTLYYILSSLMLVLFRLSPPLANRMKPTTPSARPHFTRSQYARLIFLGTEFGGGRRE